MKDSTATFSIAQLAAGGAAATVLADDIFDQPRMIALCFLGSTIGAFLSLSVFPPAEIIQTDVTPEREAVLYQRKNRRLWLNFGSSWAGGIAFTGMVFDYFELAITASRVLGLSAIVAMLAVSVIHIAAPKWEKFLDRKLDSLANKHQPPEDK